MKPLILLACAWICVALPVSAAPTYWDLNLLALREPLLRRSGTARTPLGVEPETLQWVRWIDQVELVHASFPLSPESTQLLFDAKALRPILKLVREAKVGLPSPLRPWATRNDGSPARWDLQSLKERFLLAAQNATDPYPLLFALSALPLGVFEANQVAALSGLRIQPNQMEASESAWSDSLRSALLKALVDSAKISGPHATEICEAVIGQWLSWRDSKSTEFLLDFILSEHANRLSPAVLTNAARFVRSQTWSHDGLNSIKQRVFSKLAPISPGVLFELIAPVDLVGHPLWQKEYVDQLIGSATFQIFFDGLDDYGRGAFVQGLAHFEAPALTQLRRNWIGSPAIQSLKKLSPTQKSALGFSGAPIDRRVLHPRQWSLEMAECVYGDQNCSAERALELISVAIEMDMTTRDLSHYAQALGRPEMYSVSERIFKRSVYLKALVAAGMWQQLIEKQGQKCEGLLLGRSTPPG